jgi:hypothetical protein
MRFVGLILSARHQRSVGSAGSATVILAGVLALTACGGGSSAASPTANSSAQDSTATTPAAIPVAAATKATKAAVSKRTGNCGDAELAVNVALNAQADIVDEVMNIDADPSCAELILSSALTHDLGDQAVKVCQQLSKVAFKNGFKTIHVREVGHATDPAGDLAHAIDGGPCTTS